MSLPDDGNFSDISKELLESFPLLRECGGFELLRVPSRGKSELELIPSPVGGYTTAYLKDVVKRAMSIQPIQRDLLLEPLQAPLTVSD